MFYEDLVREDEGALAMEGILKFLGIGSKPSKDDIAEIKSMCTKDKLDAMAANGNLQHHRNAACIGPT